MDVENYESFVLRGAMKLIANMKPILYCELWDNENRKQCFEMMETQGYETQVLQNGSLVAFDPYNHHQHNFFFIPIGSGKK